jgi:hypothetical protein
MMGSVEAFVLGHKDLITALFTVVLIILTGVSVAIGALTLREWRHQLLLQQWASLVGILYASKQMLEGCEERATSMSGERRVAMDARIEQWGAIEQRVNAIVKLLERRLRLPSLS